MHFIPVTVGHRLSYMNLISVTVGYMRLLYVNLISVTVGYILLYM